MPAPMKAVRKVRWSSHPDMEKFVVDNDVGTVDEISAKFEAEFGFPLSRPQIVLFRQTHGTSSRMCYNSRIIRAQQRPVGFIRDSHKGYALVKFAPMPNVPGTKDNYKPLHVAAWESYNDMELPPDMTVMSGDLNKFNVHPDNLVAVPKRLMGVMNNKFHGWTNAEELRLAAARAELHVAMIHADCRDRTCAVCGRTFSIDGPAATVSNRRTCPDCVAAGRKAMRRPRDKGRAVCAVCGEEFEKNSSNNRRCGKCVEAKPRCSVDAHAAFFARNGMRK